MVTLAMNKLKTARYLHQCPLCGNRVGDLWDRDDASIAFMGLAEITELANEIGLCFIHRFRKRLDSFVSRRM